MERSVAREIAAVQITLGLNGTDGKVGEREKEKDLKLLTIARSGTYNM